MTAAQDSRILADAVLRSAEPTPLDPHVAISYSVMVPAEHEHRLVSLERMLENPVRTRGRVMLDDTSSFIGFVCEHESVSTKVYAERNAWRFVAVFNDAVTDDHTVHTAGWADHRAHLELVPTTEWGHWHNANGVMMNQDDFAEHVEDGLNEITSPPAADMLELAQSFHAVTGVNFVSSSLLASGQRQLTYEETTTASAGRRGELKVPKDFKLGIAPFEGADRYPVTARLRYRLTGGKLSIGYKLDRPHEVLRSAFNDTTDTIGEHVTSSVFNGHPPTGMDG